MAQEIRFEIRQGTSGTAITRMWKAAVQEAMKHPLTTVVLHFEKGEHWLQPLGIVIDAPEQGLDIIVSADGSRKGKAALCTSAKPASC